MTTPLTPDLDNIESKAKAKGGSMSMPTTTVLALVAECRELRRLKGALEFLAEEEQNARLVTDYRRPGEHDSSCEATAIVTRAWRLGWKEGT